MAEKEKKPLTRAEKTEATKELVKEILQQKPTRHGELIDEVAKLYEQRHGEDGENANDVRGRVGSVLDIMKKNSDVMSDGGTYALKARMGQPPAPKAEEPVKKTAKPRAKKAKVEEIAPAPVEEKKEEPAAPKKRTRAKKAAEPAPAPVEEKAEKAEEKPAPKKRGRKPKTEEKAEGTPMPAEEKPVEKVEEPAPTPKEEKKAEPSALVAMPKAEVTQKSVMDMSFLFGDKAAPKKAESAKREAKPVLAVKKEEKPTPSPAVKKEAKPAPVAKKEERTPPVKTERAKPTRTSRTAKTPVALTPDEKLKESFLKKLRTLGGDYFEYYSTYLLERYSIKNGRRLEGLRICGGDRDGGIDGEIELTDALGFKETIYIQSKNWDPDKGKEEKWVVGETLLQQFIGACACRQAKDGRLHARGIFITTSRFTPEAKRILEDMGDKIVGYDGNDLYEAAKECEFGLVKKNGEWALDENLLAGPKAFFQMSL